MTKKIIYWIKIKQLSQHLMWRNVASLASIHTTCNFFCCQRVQCDPPSSEKGSFRYSVTVKRLSSFQNKSAWRWRWRSAAKTRWSVAGDGDTSRADARSTFSLWCTANPRRATGRGRPRHHRSPPPGSTCCSAERTCRASRPVPTCARWTRRPSWCATHYRTTQSGAKPPMSGSTPPAAFSRCVIKRWSCPEAGSQDSPSRTTRTMSAIFTTCCERMATTARTFRFSSRMEQIPSKVSSRLFSLIHMKPLLSHRREQACCVCEDWVPECRTTNKFAQKYFLPFLVRSGVNGASIYLQTMKRKGKTTQMDAGFRVLMFSVKNVIIDRFSLRLLGSSKNTSRSAELFASNVEPSDSNWNIAESKSCKRLNANKPAATLNLLLWSWGLFYWPPETQTQCLSTRSL